jgi:hypothetical protein
VECLQEVKMQGRFVQWGGISGECEVSRSLGAAKALALGMNQSLGAWDEQCVRRLHTKELPLAGERSY